MFQKLLDRFNTLNKIAALDARGIFYQLFLDKDFNDLIIRLNTEGEQSSQLIYGVNSKGEDLDEIGGPYSPYTVMLKKDKGQITDHVTLKDTGFFYRSFRTHWLQTGEIQITADTIKEGGDDLITRWGKDIIGLDDYNLGVLRDYARAKLPALIIKNIKSAA